jgi:uncharacterized protein (TIGR02246 family)
VTADEREIGRIIAAQVDGWNRGDARAWADASDDGVGFTNILGMRWDTRAGFETRHAEMFRGAFSGSHLTIEIERLRFPHPDVAVAELLTTLAGFRAVPPGIAVAADGKLYTRMLEVFVRREGGWRIVACHNTAVQPAAAPAGTDRP